MRAMRLAGDAVAEVVELPDEFDGRPAVIGDFFPAEAGFVLHIEGAAPGWVRIAPGTFAPPPPAPPPALAAMKAAARDRVLRYANGFTDQITSRYPNAEVASWPTQEAEARAVMDGAPEPATPLVNALATGFGLARADMAAIVIAKADIYRQVVAAVIITRDAALTAVDAAASGADVESALAQVQAQADALAAQFGLAGGS